MFGKPVIGTYDSSIDEMIIDGETGFLAKNADIESIKKAIKKFLNLNSVQREAMRQKIISHIEAIKCEDRVGQLTEFYKQAINNFKVQHGNK
jgi:glycosyltransferase involved in cell wall biosynthesis